MVFVKMAREFNLSVYNSISDINKEFYNEIVDSGNPFLEYEFLEALEKSGAIGHYTTWIPRYIILRDAKKS